MPPLVEDTTAAGKDLSMQFHYIMLNIVSWLAKIPIEMRRDGFL